MIPLDITFIVVAASLGVLIILCVIRAFLGPTTPDRVVALDTTNTLVVASLVIIGVIFGEIIFIDVGIVYAMLAFVSTLYISKHLEDNK